MQPTVFDSELFLDRLYALRRNRAGHSGIENTPGPGRPVRVLIQPFLRHAKRDECRDQQAQNPHKKG